MATSVTISLTPAEKLFRQCLLDCRGSMQSVPGMKDLVLRFTGGWVRDKLLGTQSHDIDVALSTMTGWQFGLAMQEFMRSHGSYYEQEAERQGIPSAVKDIHKIEANPEKSKHLETITTRMFGIDVDFVNLRKEVYDETSRNPTMEFGTPEEDALRRDATVNALFYNLDTQLVEDFTGRGLEDMKQKIIRTPLAPYQTFKDDPLRVLRLIRFACRLGYEIDHEAREAMKDKTIHEALRIKISRERVGVEINKIMDGPDPYTGLKDINDLGLYNTVFADPNSNEEDADSIDPSKALRAYDGLRRILETKPTLCLSLRPKQDQRQSWFLAAYVPWADLESESSAARAYNASREGIKATNSMSRVLKESIDLRPDILVVLKAVQDDKVTRSQVGMLLRQCKEHWRAHVLYSLLCDVAEEGEFAQVTDLYQKFVGYIHDQKLEDAYLMAPILKGNEITQALGGPKGGPWLKRAVDLLAEWQFSHPEATKEEAVDMIVSKKDELNITEPVTPSNKKSKTKKSS
ncbi:CCA tRNA nucleotidyltransferase, mitochondrial [Exophiala dermatitidis]|uniref:tRNA nucleotidyltransferase (CCA-adding enzyme) n=2 Tax=Exophiala dermatitidis TaxID=5970 RepID=H6BRQ5_EXODN|nr:tRNA nucleotidyltransferase (CCA-adding enzyme) [Exophiala dermatitidis NIH/UT8656]KAJ4515645.1 CCA tRNA nucleotidyltransferase, mitochondrial [Exophiala dermatitidis]EHY54007.1 tRNA nucleotidyltransferase (CCA-adding enzyme) [Exophiala dermatitidis NIH/UT8656]KAJ4519327.1 CCA tRNA nucleotidyltransferase, mitochondrial [Exophiala dermatitidis]KAJ4529143.1 CCA tRNA nucleotidyltransferase, mitochondrial [Exophiala dermatitidis]KAJ4538543.1 CCA tRNA nucleotidyltransferase, mitochondrial [Exoph